MFDVGGSCDMNVLNFTVSNGFSLRNTLREVAKSRLHTSGIGWPRAAARTPGCAHIRWRAAALAFMRAGNELSLHGGCGGPWVYSRSDALRGTGCLLAFLAGANALLPRALPGRMWSAPPCLESESRACLASDLRAREGRITASSALLLRRVLCALRVYPACAALVCVRACVVSLCVCVCGLPPRRGTQHTHIFNIWSGLT